MSQRRVHVRELACWGWDTYEFRPAHLQRTKLLEIAHSAARRNWSQQSSIVLAEKTEELCDAFLNHSSRPDLLAEMDGLTWSLGVVDLRPLIAFQRRLSFDPEFPQPSPPGAQNWPALFSHSFGSAKTIECDWIQHLPGHALTLRSSNPNLHIRTTTDVTSPISIHAGGSFLEVACLQGRWFLRDGYHRAYALLRAQVFEVPAVIVQARTIQELGASQPWFFPEDVLFSETPPHVCDFLEDDLTIEYDRPPLSKTLRITMEEILAPSTLTGEQS